MGNWFTVFDAAFFAQLTRFPEKERCQIIEKISLLSKDPLPNGHAKRQLVHQENKIYRLRSGRYRVIYSFKEPYIGIIALVSRDDETYEQVFLPAKFNEINEITDRFDLIDSEFLKTLEEKDLQTVRDNILKSISRLRQREKSFLEREKSFISDEKALHSLSDELNSRNLNLKFRREDLGKREARLKSQENEVAKERLESSNLLRKLSVARKILIRKKGEIAEERQNIDRERKLALEEAKNLIVERMGEARNWTDSLVPPPPLSVVVSQKPDEKVLLLPEAKKFKFNISFGSNDKTSIYLFILGAFFILMPWPSVLKFSLFLPSSMVLISRSLKEVKRNRKELSKWCAEFDKSCSEYEKISNLILASYFDQLEIYKVTQSGTEDFVKRVEWWRKESFSIVLGEINNALEETVDTLDRNQKSQ